MSLCGTIREDSGVRRGDVIVLDFAVAIAFGLLRIAYSGLANC